MNHFFLTYFYPVQIPNKGEKVFDQLSVITSTKEVSFVRLFRCLFVSRISAYTTG